MFYEAIGEVGVAFGGLLHEVDAAAGRIHLFAPEPVGRAGGKAKAAVDALLIKLGGRRIVIVENRGATGPVIADH